MIRTENPVVDLIVSEDRHHLLHTDGGVDSALRTVRLLIGVITSRKADSISSDGASVSTVGTRYPGTVWHARDHRRR